MPLVFNNAVVTESVSIELIPQTLEIEVFETAYTTEDITNETVSLNVSIVDNVRTSIILEIGYATAWDRVIPTEDITVEVGEDTLYISVDDQVRTRESLFDYLSINIIENVVTTEALTFDPLQISIVENVIPGDAGLVYLEKYESLPSQPWDGISDPPITGYGDHDSADLLRGDTGYEQAQNFWNEPFPEDLQTVTGKTANFSKTWNKTHTSLKRRKCAIKVEVLRSDNSIEEIDIGTFLVDAIEQVEDDTISLRIEDLTKPMIETRADDIKSGFQWHRNIPLHHLVKELVKKNYPDPRNGEIPRDYIIKGIRPPNPSGEKIISSLGRPPTFTRLTDNLNAVGKCRALAKGDLGIRGEKLYLGIGKFLYEYDETEQTYLLIGEVFSNYQGYEDVVYNIKHLWYNNESALDDKYIYGVAWPEEELVYDDGEYTTGNNLNMRRYSAVTSNDFIIFRANNDGIENLFDSATKVNAVEQWPNLFSGEYHIFEPYLEGWPQNQDDYYHNTLNKDFAPAWYHYHDTWPKKAIHVGVGRMAYATDTYNPYGDKYRPSIWKNGWHGCGYTENLIIPYSQTIGFGGNINVGLLWPCWGMSVDYTASGWTSYNEIPYTNYIGNFGMTPGPEEKDTLLYTGWKYLGYTGQWHKYYPFRARPRFQVKAHPTIDTEHTHMIGHLMISNHPTQHDTYFICQTKTPTWIHGPANPPVGYFRSYETHETFNGLLPSVHYESETPHYEYLPFENNAEHKFDPGYFSWFFEGMMYNSYNWDYAPIPWIKYSSGQVGCTQYLPNWGTKGGIFFQGQIKTDGGNSTGTNSSPQRKTMGWRDLYSTGPSGSVQRFEMKLTCYIFDLDTLELYPIQGMDYNNFVDEREDGNHYLIQLTASAARPDNNWLFVSGQTFPNKHKVVPDQSANENKFKTKAYLYRIELGSVVGGVVQATKHHLLDGPAGDYWWGNKNYTILDLNVLSNSDNSTKKLFITYFEKDKILKESTFEDRPIIGNCYGLAHHGMTNLAMSLNNDFFNPGGFYQDRLMPYPLLRLVQSSESSMPGWLNSFYCYEPMDRTEELNNVRLRHFGYDDTFYPYQGGGGVTHPYNDPDTGTQLFINDAVYGEANNLSNIELFVLDGVEIVYGVTGKYYFNPINKSGGKNHLWKYDSFLGGIIELADLSGLKVWEALGQLAHGFNYLTGFDDDRFFFIPKTLSSTPDILLDLDIDGVISARKIRDDKVENIIRSTPWIAQLGDIEWSIILVPNETTAQDLDRTQLNAELRVQQYDDLTKKVQLRVYSKGLIPPQGESSPLRFSYLIYNNVLETKLIRDIDSNETVLTLPSFFGEDLSNQVKRGDIIALEYTDASTGDTYSITRTIKDINYNYNLITVHESFGRNFVAYSPVTIYRSFTNQGDILRNHQWSDGGVTFIPTDGSIYEGTTSNTRLVDVGSIRNLSEGTIIKLGDYPQEYEIERVVELSDNPISYPQIEIKSFQSSILPTTGGFPIETQNNRIIRAWWYPKYDELVEVGGSKVFIGFAQGSEGAFWQNFRGEDRIEINCPGLKLEQDARAIITVVDADSIAKYGKIEKNLDNIRFIQPVLHQYHARTHLHEFSKPRLGFKISDFIQTMDKGGYSYMLPAVKLLNASERKLFTVRVISKKYLPRFWGYYTDCYIMEHGFNLQSFTQSLTLRSRTTY